MKLVGRRRRGKKWYALKTVKVNTGDIVAFDFDKYKSRPYVEFKIVVVGTASVTATLTTRTR